MCDVCMCMCMGAHMAQLIINIIRFLHTVTTFKPGDLSYIVSSIVSEMTRRLEWKMGGQINSTYIYVYYTHIQLIEFLECSWDKCAMASVGMLSAVEGQNDILFICIYGLFHHLQDQYLYKCARSENTILNISSWMDIKCWYWWMILSYERSECWQNKLHRSAASRTCSKFTNNIAYSAYLKFISALDVLRIMYVTVAVNVLPPFMSSFGRCSIVFFIKQQRML